MKNKENQDRKTISNNLKSVYAIIGIFAFLIGVIIGFYKFIDWKIESKINDQTFLRKLSQSVRPSLIFDQEGIYLANMGALSYIEEISVSEIENDSLEIIVTFSELINIKPILESLDGDYTITTEQGPNFDWIFHLEGINRLALVDSPEYGMQRFRLELVR